MTENVFGLFECPDCSAVSSAETGLVHSGGCVADADRIYFEQHPKESQFTRPGTLSESQMARSAGHGPDDERMQLTVIVCKINPWTRARLFTWALPV